MVVTFLILLLLLTKKEGNLECYKHLQVFSSLPKNLPIKRRMNYKSEFQIPLTVYGSVLSFDMHVLIDTNGSYTCLLWDNRTSQCEYTPLDKQLCLERG